MNKKGYVLTRPFLPDYSRTSWLRRRRTLRPYRWVAAATTHIHHAVRGLTIYNNEYTTTAVHQELEHLDHVNTTTTTTTGAFFEAFSEAFTPYLHLRQAPI